MSQKIKNALVSVSDKENLISILKILNKDEILSLSDTDINAFFIFNFILNIFLNFPIKRFIFIN